MKTIMPCLWFDGQAEDAANFYTSVFPSSRIIEISRYPQGSQMPEGTVLTVDFEINGFRVQALNGGPEFTFSEAVSLSVECESQEEVDRLWMALTAEGGEESQCGWLKDKYGFSWQIVPIKVVELLSAPDKAASKRAFDAVMKMRKIDIAAVERAFSG
jgi:predicted 3-demethylubiquinone-9 3-methyltransferase (glyoxalase superfamily)